MIIPYSRQAQFVLLACWIVGMTFAYVRITGESPHWLMRAGEKIVEKQEARLGRMPEPIVPAPQPLAVQAARPAADPELNRCLAVRVRQGAGEREDALILELDYVAAQKEGFAVEKARGYYLDDEPTFVVALGAPWTSDMGNASFPVAMPQVAKVSLIVSKSRNLRLLVHTKSMSVSRGAKSYTTPTDTGMRVEIRLPGRM